jgi:phosphomannomutase/phosphoglucomutase
MVTGSCGSFEENGFDITLGKLPASDIDICELRQMVRNKGPFASGAGIVQHHRILEPYVSFLVARFVPVPPLRVLVDGLNGCMGQLAASTLGFLGCSVVERNCDPLPDFGQAPDPLLAENRTALSRAVLSHHAQLGVSYDGDGDTVLFAVEQGTILTPEQTLVLLAHALLPHQPGSQVVYDAGYAPFVADQIRRAGGKPISAGATSGEIRRAFLEQGAVLGADLQGHYMFRAMGGGDALYATLVMLRISAGHENTLELVIADWPSSP